MTNPRTTRPAIDPRVAALKIALAAIAEAAETALGSDDADELIDVLAALEGAAWVAVQEHHGLDQADDPAWDASYTTTDDLPSW